MTVSNQQNTRYWLNEALFFDKPPACFMPDYWQQKQAILGSAKGRGITWFVQTSSVPAALRHYCRGGLWGKLVKDNYFFCGFENTRPAREFLLLKTLEAANFPAPRPLAAQVVKKGFFYQGDILVEQIPDSQDLVSVLEKAPLKDNQYQKIGQLIRKLHDLAICHTDLNIHNILQDSKANYWLIDFDKCGEKSGESWKKANLARLLRSFEKEKKKRAINWQASDWQALLQGYGCQI